MSHRALVEFNHDLIHRIEDNPARFVEFILLNLGDGGLCGNANTDDEHTGNLHRKLWSFGVSIKHRMHHSNDSPTGFPS